MEKLAILGGTPAIGTSPEELFRWPIVTKEDEDAILDVLYKNKMSGIDVTEKFEQEFADWSGLKYGVGFNNGTLALQAAMFACGLSKGDELICPSKTYWASCLQAFNLGATVVFADIDKKTLCISPEDLERVIGPKTKAIVAVHYLSHPAPMDKIMEIANKHGIYVIEDVSHAQGGYYKGQKLGTFGHVAAMSLMSGKSFATGEMGILVTNDKAMRDRSIAYSHYERNNANYITTPGFENYYNLPLGGIKGRVNQMCSAMGRVQLKYYDERTAEIRKSMNYFWDLLEGVPGIEAHRVDEKDGSTMGGWYAPHGIYHPEQLNGLDLGTFCAAVTEEGFTCTPGANFPLHTHNLFNTYSSDSSGIPQRIAGVDRDVRELDKALRVSKEIQIFSVPWFKKYKMDEIRMYANAFKKVAENAAELLASGIKKEENTDGRWFFYNDKEAKK